MIRQYSFHCSFFSFSGESGAKSSPCSSISRSVTSASRSETTRPVLPGGAGTDPKRRSFSSLLGVVGDPGAIAKGYSWGRPVLISRIGV